MTMDDMIAIVKPHNDKIIAEGRAKAAEHKAELFRKALEQIRMTCEGNAGPSCDKGMALEFVGRVAEHALTFVSHSSPQRQSGD